jgi:GTP-binding protein HflX
VDWKRHSGRDSALRTEESLEELAELAASAGAEIVDRVIQARPAPEASTLIGQGKVEELAAAVLSLPADVLIFDHDLTPTQQRNLEKAVDAKIIDRTQLILDIFASRARTREGRLQVELAQLNYLLPRLTGRGAEMSRLGGGIGTRGPGETQLEVDRRRILSRVAKLERDLDRLSKNRSTQRKARRRSAASTLALVGYTNAGKSSLLNRLTTAEVRVEDRLFSTLDPTTRRLRLPGGETVVVSDTVGFVQRLPHQLVESFQSTLEEVVAADLLLHVVDGSSPDASAQIGAVHAVLRDIGADHVPELLVVNKADIAGPDAVAELRAAHPLAVVVSAATGDGLDDLVDALSQRLRHLAPIVEFIVPFERGDVVAALHRAGDVLVEVHSEGGTRVRARLPALDLTRFREYVVAGGG